MGGTEVAANPLATMVDPYRDRFAEDVAEYTQALLALAKANADGTTGFNEPSPQDAVVLHVLVRWRRDAQQAKGRVQALDADLPGKALAIRWLKALIAGIDLQRQSLSLVDPAAAADAARRGGKAIARSQRLQAKLDRELT